ncbi:HD domain-containing protein [Chlorobaculum sp. 24CR]|uniref:HD domain-containing protein n=1 Tax=Chlorobaculum sp. 24CR TaxID=2508878 RepID=UPI00100ADA93|nr:HD domain-containing protein [Chlorobaculum sp. 24CR]RXK89467.1 HD domain-containing protein [Chlorobaculum sp. 24CR]
MIAEPFLFRSEGGFIRIPIWGHIPLSAPLKKILAHPSFLRLKGIRQLSFAQQVYPGANHTRFEHSIGVYHLMKMILQRMVSNPLALELQSERLQFDDETCRTLLATCLLHDIGHYPHAHVLEEITPAGDRSAVFAHHESLTGQFLNEEHHGSPSIAAILHDDWRVDPGVVTEIIAGKTAHPLGKLVSGTLDPDKMDYLMRDAHHCNIPYGSIDIERLIESFVPDPERRRLAITEKGIAPLESLLFAKYMMMRNVYWHHTSRTFAAMLRRLLQEVADDGRLPAAALRELFYFNSDDRVLYELERLIRHLGLPAAELLDAILERRVYKRAMTIRPYSGPEMEIDPVWFAYSADHCRRKEKELEICDLVGRKTGKRLAGHEVLIDAPASKDVFDYDDFRELRVWPTKSEHRHMAQPTDANGYIRFDDFRESVFGSDFILSFERYTKKFRVLCRPDLIETLSGLEAEVLEILRG